MSENSARKSAGQQYKSKNVDESHYEVLKRLIGQSDEDRDLDEASKSLLDELTATALLKSEENNF